MLNIEQPEHNGERQENLNNETTSHYKELLMNILNSINPENYQNNLENTANFSSQVIDLENGENLDLPNINTILNFIKDQEIAILGTKTKGNYLQIIRNGDKFELQYFINGQSFGSKELVDNLNISYPNNNSFNFAEINYNGNHYGNIKEVIIYNKIVKNTPIMQENQIIEDKSTQEPILSPEDFKKLLENSKIGDRVEVGDYSYVKGYGVRKKLNKLQSLSAEKNYIKLVDNQEIIDEFYSFYNIEKLNLSHTTTLEQKIIKESEISKPTLRLNIERNNKIAKEVSIGDLHGNYDSLIGNLKYAGLIDENLNWIGGNTKLIFHGDIIGDRGTTSLKSLSKIVELKKQAELLGGEIIYLLGNHDSFAFEFLGDYSVKGHISNRNTSPKNWPDEFIKQSVGLMEFQSNFGDDKKIYTNGILGPKKIDIKKLQSGPELLKNMKNDEYGKKILEAMCEYDIFVFKNGVLYTHTPINEFIAEKMLSEGVENFVNRINKEFKKSAKKVLFGDQTPTFLEDLKQKVKSFLFNYTEKIFKKSSFLDTLSKKYLSPKSDYFLNLAKERLRFIGEKISYTGNKLSNGNIDSNSTIFSYLKKAGVIKIIHGHEGYSNNHGPIETISVDTKYGKYGDLSVLPAVYINENK